MDTTNSLYTQYSPYVMLPGVGCINDCDATNVSLSAVLADRTINQVKLLISHIRDEKLDHVPLVVQSMANENHQILTVIFNMLLAYEDFLTSGAHADVREKLSIVFSPMAVTINGHYSITTPALLVLQSILYSHCEWFRPNLFESYSAIRAHDELGLLGFPESHTNFIAAIIAHQTLLRSAWGDSSNNDIRETIGFYKDNGELKCAATKDQDDVVGLAISKTLFAELRTTKKTDTSVNQLAASLILHALCLQSRHSHSASNNLSTNVKKQSLQFFDRLLAFEREAYFPEAGLIFINYGRYVYQAQKQSGKYDSDNLFCKVVNHLCNSLKNANTDCGNITYCFPRVTSKKVWYGEKTWDETKKSNFEEKFWMQNDGSGGNYTCKLQKLPSPQTKRSICEQIGATIGSLTVDEKKVFGYRVYHLNKIDQLCSVLNIKENNCSSIIEKWLAPA